MDLIFWQFQTGIDPNGTKPKLFNTLSYLRSIAKFQPDVLMKTDPIGVRVLDEDELEVWEFLNSLYDEVCHIKRKDIVEEHARLSDDSFKEPKAE